MLDHHSLNVVMVAGHLLHLVVMLMVVMSVIVHVLLMMRLLASHHLLLLLNVLSLLRANDTVGHVAVSLAGRVVGLDRRWTLKLLLLEHGLMRLVGRWRAHERAAGKRGGSRSLYTVEYLARERVACPLQWSRVRMSGQLDPKVST